MLVREEEDASLLRERPLHHLGGVAGGADDAAMLADKRLQRRRRVHVGDRRRLLRDASLLQLFPAGVDVLGVGHVGHRAAGGHVRQYHLLVRRAEDIGGFRHEVDAAEYDELGLRVIGRPAGEVERVALEVRELDDVLSLVVVAEDDAARTQPLPGAADPFDDLLWLKGGVRFGDVLLPEPERSLFRERHRLRAVALAGDAGEYGNAIWDGFYSHNFPLAGN